jgi:hypothetical protein
MLYVHLSDETKKAILANRIRKRLFENLLLGVNLFSLEDIERVAKGVLQIPEPRLKNITRPEFMRSSLHGVDFIEESGYLV